MGKNISTEADDLTLDEYKDLYSGVCSEKFGLKKMRGKVMKKGRAIEDNELKKASGGYIYKKDYPGGWACIYPFPRYQVVDEKGNNVGNATADRSEAARIAKENNLSTEIIDKYRLEALRGNNKFGSPFIFGNTHT